MFSIIIINKPLFLHLVSCLYYLYQWCTEKQMSNNEVYLLIKYIKNVLWKVAKRLSYIEDAWCLKVNKSRWNRSRNDCAPFRERLVMRIGTRHVLPVCSAEKRMTGLSRLLCGNKRSSNFLRSHYSIQQIHENSSSFYTLNNNCTIISQIKPLLHVSTLSCHPQGACNVIVRLQQL